MGKVQDRREANNWHYFKLMPPRRRQQFTQDQIDLQLQQIHLLDPSSASENLEQLGPIIKQIHTNLQQDVYLRTIRALINSKDAEIENICSENYQDFISSVSTLFTVKSYSDKMKENISSLDTSVHQLGGGLVEKKRALLLSKKTAANLDEAIDTLQACLRVLDVVDRVGDMIRQGKYWSALRVCPSIPLCPAVYSINILSPWMLAVPRRYPEYAAYIAFADSSLSTPVVFFAITSKSNKGCRYGLNETVAFGNPEHQHWSRSTGCSSYGSPNETLASTTRKRSPPAPKSCRQCRWIDHIWESRMYEPFLSLDITTMLNILSSQCIGQRQAPC